MHREVATLISFLRYFTHENKDGVKLSPRERDMCNYQLNYNKIER